MVPALSVASVGSFEFYIIFRFASWPAFSWNIFFVFGLPVYLLATVFAAVTQGRAFAQKVARDALRGVLGFGLPLFLVAVVLGRLATQRIVASTASRLVLRNFWLLLVPAWLVWFGSLGALGGALIRLILEGLSKRSDGRAF